MNEATSGNSFLGNPGGRRATRQRLDAALVDAARSIAAARTAGEGDDGGAPLLARCDALLQSARAAANSGARLLAWDCLYQIERELVETMDAEVRRETVRACLAQTDALDAGRRAAARTLAPSGEDSVAVARALLRNLHEAKLERECDDEQLRAQLVVIAVLMATAVGFVGTWALVGGFDWVLQNDIDVTLAMLLVNGMMFGYLGALLSGALRLIRLRGSGARDVRRSAIAAFARPFIGALIAVPIVFVLQSNVLNMGDVSPVVDLLACFAGGFLERSFAAQLERGRRSN